jgi:hypothetical protein
MTTLPRHLAPWAAQLGLFPEDIAQTLGGMAARLAGLIGGWPVSSAAEGEPDGYDGIGRKGPYDRLLAAEWLLLEEVPDEFLRRAVSAEHMFLQRAYQSNTAARRCTVLFDAGPEQLGAPRIAHLALLIVLAERAERNGAEFRWAVLQDEDARAQEGLDKAQTAKLLEARYARPGTAADIARRMEAAPGASELWLAGGPRLADEAAQHGAAAISVSEVMEPDAPARLLVSVQPPGQSAARQAVLDLPPPDMAVRLLRDPFGVSVAPKQTVSAPVDVNSNIVFALDGRRLYMRGEGGTLVTIRIPNSPRAAPQPPPAVFRPPEGDTILAVGHSLRHTYVVTQCGNTLTVHELTSRGASALRSWTFNNPDQTLLPVSLYKGMMPLRPLAVINAERRIFNFAGPHGHVIELTQAAIYSFNVLPDVFAAASRVSKQGLVFVRRHKRIELMRPDIILSRYEDGKFTLKPVSVKLPVLPSGTFYYFASGGLANMAAYSPDASQCTFVHELNISTVVVPSEYTVAGMVCYLKNQAEPAVICIHESRTRIAALRGGNMEVLVTTAEPVAQIAVSDMASVIAFVTQSGGIGIYACWAGAMVLHPAGGGQ